jgi:carboxylesterase
MPQIIETAEPFLFPGSKVGCLLIHGFTGTPKEMRWMGEYLAEQGYSVLAVRLSGHATHPEDMIHSHASDWIATVEDGYHLLRGLAEHVYLVGLSMGGVLSLLMSTQLDVSGVVGISTPYQLPSDWRLNFIEFLSLFQTYAPKSKLPPGSDWFDQDARMGNVSYPQNPVRSVGELNKLIAQMRVALPQVKVPVLLIHSMDDRYVLPENLERIYQDLIGVQDKTKFYITESGHVVTRDSGRRKAFKAVSEFIDRVESGLQ